MPGAREVAQRLEHRLVAGPGGTAGATGHHEVQPDVGGLREQRDEGAQGRAGRGDDEVVVVDEDERLGARPPRAGPQLLGGDVRPGETGAQEGGEPLHLGGDLLLGRHVLGDVVRRQLAEQGTPVVDDEELGLVGRVEAGDLAGVAPQHRGLARVGVAEEVEVGLLRDVDADRLEVALVDAEQDALVVRTGLRPGSPRG